MKSILCQGPPIREAWDTTTDALQTYFDQLNAWVAAQSDSIEQLDTKARNFGDDGLAFRIGLKFIESAKVIEKLDRPLTLTLVNPVYKETGRLQRRSGHPHGEDSLRTKIACLEHFEAVNANFTGRVFVVDDECPEGSGAMAEEILREYPGSPHQVYFLGRAIDQPDIDLPPGLTHKSGSNRSVKGGAALFGMRKALKQPAEGLHIIVDNDADLSVHPMQLGLLIRDIVDGKVAAVAGSRREVDSVSLIGGSRNRRGNLFIQIWQHFLPQLAQRVTDTNRAFKAFESSALERILPSIQIYTFPYQIELLQACISMDVPLIKKGIAYVDSEAASTQSGDNITETYLNQIHQIIDIARRYATIDPSDALMQYFSSISEDEWRRIEGDPPEKVADLVRGRKEE